MVNGRKTLNMMLGVAVLAWLLAWASPVAASGPVLAADVNEPFEVGGEMYPAGTLVLKGMREYSPTQSIHEIWLDDTCLGYHLARKGVPESSGPVTDSMFFTRSAEGHLVLAGYTVASGGAGEMYRFPQEPVPDTGFYETASLR